MLKFQKMMVVEDVIITEEVLVVVLVKQFSPRREGTSPKRRFSGGFRSDRSAQEKAVLA
jgi:hypothetical protein